MFTVIQYYITIKKKDIKESLEESRNYENQ